MGTGLHHDQSVKIADPVGACLFEASHDCVKLIDLDGRLLAMNVNGLCLMEIDDLSSLKGQTWASFWPERSRPLVANAVSEAAGGVVSRFTAECATAKGRLKTWDVIMSPVFDEVGRPIQIVSISRETTEQQRTFEQTALMVLELSHRLKNVFAVVDGAISLMARTEPESGAFADQLRKRLNALGRATAYLSPPDAGWQGLPVIPTLQGLLRTLLEPYVAIDGPERQLAIEGSDCSIGQSATTALALVINELATNALKYGALRSPGGRIVLTVIQSAGSIALIWQETVERVEPPTGASNGFGTTLLDHSVVRLLKGALQRDWLPGGLCVSIRIPAERLIH